MLNDVSEDSSQPLESWKEQPVTFDYCTLFGSFRYLKSSPAFEESY